jgi:hypothetical protein
MEEPNGRAIHARGDSLAGIRPCDACAKRGLQLTTRGSAGIHARGDYLAETGSLANGQADPHSPTLPGDGGGRDIIRGGR